MQSMENRIRRGGTRTPEGYLYELTGGDICLDFVNTVDMRPTDQPAELIPTYGDYCSWARQAGLLTGESEAQLLRRAARRPAEAETVRRQAVAARECLFQILARVSGGGSVPPDLMQQWNRIARQAMARYELAPSKDGFAWRCLSEPSDFDSILWPVVHSAVRLLTGPGVDRIRKCSGLNCNWMFLDTSKRGNRRWCDMTVCGNRAKARRFYSKKKQAENP
jgi:predicted RNA-binding Zn ribbon-like protein